MSNANRRFIFLLSQAQRHVARTLEQKAQALGDATPTQAGVLYCLLEENGRSSTEVAKAVGIAAPAMSTLTERMVQRGLIERKVDQLDARVNRLFITELGRLAAQQSLGIVREVNHALCQDFTEAELDTVARWLLTAASINKAP